MDHVQKQHFKFKSSPFKVFLKILPSVQYVVLGPEEKDEMSISYPKRGVVS